MNAPQILTTEHPAFWTFCNRLDAALWPEGKQCPSCDRTLNSTIEILNTIPDVDIDGSLEWLRSQGGHCDCEVMLNVVVPYDGA